MSSRTFTEMSTPTKVLLGALAAVQVGLLGAAHWDISHRDPEDLRGSPMAWRAITLLNFVGPIAYFLRGRK